LRVFPVRLSSYAKGALWARAKAWKSMGKDHQGSYRPSLWLMLKAFTSKDGAEALPNALGDYAPGDLLTCGWVVG